MSQPDYYKYASKSRLDKAINSLLGLLHGITADTEINYKEAQFLIDWLRDNYEFKERHPFNELMPIVNDVLSNKFINEEDLANLTWLCNQLKSTSFFDTVTVDIQTLHAVVAGIAADGIINERELVELSKWIRAHEYLRKCWPYDEIESLVSKVMADLKITEEEHKILLQFFSQFIAIGDKRTVNFKTDTATMDIMGICALNPCINFRNSVFCVTGKSPNYSKNQFKEIVESLGGIWSETVNQTVNYLVIAKEGNRCWAYACYGRKIEKAVQIRKEGHRLLLIDEDDFIQAAATWKAMANAKWQFGFNCINYIPTMSKCRINIDQYRKRNDFVENKWVSTREMLIYLGMEESEIYMLILNGEIQVKRKQLDGTLLYEIKGAWAYDECPLSNLGGMCMHFKSHDGINITSLSELPDVKDQHPNLKIIATDEAINVFEKKVNEALKNNKQGT